MRIELHHRMNNLTCARIGMRHANGPATTGAIRPLNCRIPDVEWTRAFRQVFDAQRIFESCLLKRRIPPQRSPLRGGANGLWNGAIKIKNDWPDRFAQHRAGILLLQTPSADAIT